MKMSRRIFSASLIGRGVTTVFTKSLRVRVNVKRLGRYQGDLMEAPLAAWPVECAVLPIERD